MSKNSDKERLDKILVDRGLSSTRAQAQALIMDGKVQVNGLPITKPGTLVAITESQINVCQPPPFVSRGGLKLAKALEVFNINPSGRVCLDIGASTGGFTDCLLQNGAAYVMAVDVGYGQLDWKLRQDERVQVLEKTNVRHLKAEALNQEASLGVVDTSFISLSKVLPPMAALLTAEAEILALLKPQFEYKEFIQNSSFRGVVRGKETHMEILNGALAQLAILLPDWYLMGLDFSPITGPKGNIEYLLYYKRGNDLHEEIKNKQLRESLQQQIEKVVQASYESHDHPST